MIFIFNTRTFWEEPPRARHQLARALASEGMEIYFIAKNKKGNSSIQIIEVEKNIFLIEPYWKFPGVVNYRLPVFNEKYQKWLFEQVKKKFGDIPVVNFDPSAWLLNDYFSKVIYFCNDNFIAYKRSKCFLVSVYHYLTERKVIENSVFSCGVSKYLYSKLSKYTDNAHLFLTAAPNINYDFDVEETRGIPVKGNDKIKVVYVGWVNKIDVEWLGNAVTKKNYDITVIGPNYSKLKNKFNGMKNIKFIGEKRGDELYGYLAKADVAIAPYVDDNDSRKVYTMPNKFWLYLAFGLPIVTRKINNLADLPKGFVYQADSAEEFTAKIAEAAEGNSVALRKNRMAFAKENTWEKRGKEFKNLLEKYL